VQARDAGSYECQISTVPKKMHFFNLAVVGKKKEKRESPSRRLINQVQGPE
jgi:hypothetical protein